MPRLFLISPIVNARLVRTQRILGGADLAADLARMSVQGARMVGLHVVDHVVPLARQVGAGQAAVLLLSHPREILRQGQSLIPCTSHRNRWEMTERDDAYSGITGA